MRKQSGLWKKSGVVPLFFILLGNIPIDALSASDTARAGLSSTSKVDSVSMKLEGVEKRTLAIEEKLKQDLEPLKAKVDVAANYVGIGQKQVDWWLQTLTLGLAVVAAALTAAGIFAPIFFTRNLRREYESAIRGAREAESSARSAAALATQHAQAAGEMKNQIGLAQSQTNASKPMPANQIVDLQTKIADANCSEENRLLYQTLLEQQRENWVTAVALAAEFIKKFPTGRSAYLRLGYSKTKLALTRRAEERQRLLREAISSYQTELEFEPRSSIAKSNIGWTLTELADLEPDQSVRESMLDQAIASLEDASKLDPLNADAWNNLGWIHLQRAKVEIDIETRNALAHKSITYFEKALSANPSHELPTANIRLAQAVIAMR